MVKNSDIKKLSYLDMQEFRVFFYNNYENEHVIYTQEEDGDEVYQMLEEYEKGVRVSLDMIFLNTN
tara:strand:+ start:940 stop:1137 length:198 start_codon:yes stop_codon:yes gene_type:complete